MSLEKEATDAKLPEDGQYFVKTWHNSYLYFLDDHLYHGFLEDLPDTVTMASLTITDILSNVTRWPLDDVFPCFIEGGDVVFRRKHRFLCAEANTTTASFSRDRAGPWERFRLVNALGLFEPKPRFSRIPMKMSDNPVATSIEIQASEEIYDAPRTISQTDLDYFLAADKKFFPVSPGLFHLKSNRICHGKELVLSTRYMSHGVIMDRDGFYHNPGFLYLRNDQEDILLCDGEILVDLQSMSKKKLYGKFLAPFNGNSFNYYHWLLEGMMSLYIMTSRGMLHPPIIVVGSGGLNEWQVAYLKIFGIQRYLVVDGESADGVEVEHLFWLEHRDLPDIPAALFIDFRNLILSRVVGKEPVGSRRLYIRRLEGPRSVENSKALELLLESHGFDLLDLESLDIQTQITRFHYAEIVLAPHGAGLANIIYCQQGAKIIELVPDSADVRTCFWCLAEKLKLSYTLVRCSATNGYGGPMNVDLETFTDVFRS